MRRSALFFLLLGLAGAPLEAQNQPDPAALALARRLLTLMHAPEQMNSSLSSMIATQRQAQTGLPPIFWDSLQVRFHRQMPTLVEQTAALYTRHYSKAELQQLLNFYATPLGRRVATETGPLTRESMATGQSWGAQIGQQLVGELQEKGLIGR